MSKTTCKYDSGSATDCIPLCNRPAEFLVAYRNGSYPVHRAPVCAGHRQAMEGRAYPGHIETVPAGSVSVESQK